MPDPRSFILELDPALRPPMQPLDEHIVPDFDWFGTHRASRRAGEGMLAIEGVVIHATAGSTAAGALSWWRQPAVKASAHWLVPAEREPLHGKEVIAVVPEARAAWHVLPKCAHPAVNDGKARINGWSLGVEIVNTQRHDDDFSDWQSRQRRPSCAMLGRNIPTSAGCSATQQLIPRGVPIRDLHFPGRTSCVPSSPPKPARHRISAHHACL